jgi:flagellar motility protein MotE (MotC chaperone)
MEEQKKPKVILGLAEKVVVILATTILTTVAVQFVNYLRETHELSKEASKVLGIQDEIKESLKNEYVRIDVYNLNQQILNENLKELKNNNEEIKTLLKEMKGLDD